MCIASHERPQAIYPIEDQKYSEHETTANVGNARARRNVRDQVDDLDRSQRYETTAGGDREHRKQDRTTTQSGDEGEAPGGVELSTIAGNVTRAHGRAHSSN